MRKTVCGVEWWGGREGSELGGSLRRVGQGVGGVKLLGSVERVWLLEAEGGISGREVGEEGLGSTREWFTAFTSISFPSDVA